MSSSPRDRSEGGSPARSRSRSIDSKRSDDDKGRRDSSRSPRRVRERSRSYSRSRSPPRERERDRRERDRDYDRRDDRYGGGDMRSGGRSNFPVQERRPGDWDCEECRAHNFASRDRCYKCGASGGRGGGGGGFRGYGGGGNDRGFDRGYDRRDQRDRFPTGGSRLPSNFKPGDWLCNDCQTHNFAARAQCFRCGSAK